MNNNSNRISIDSDGDSAAGDVPPDDLEDSERSYKYVCKAICREVFKCRRIPTPGTNHSEFKAEVNKLKHGFNEKTINLLYTHVICNQFARAQKLEGAPWEDQDGIRGLYESGDLPRYKKQQQKQKPKQQQPESSSSASSAGSVVSSASSAGSRDQEAAPSFSSGDKRPAPGGAEPELTTAQKRAKLRESMLADDVSSSEDEDDDEEGSAAAAPVAEADIPRVSIHDILKVYKIDTLVDVLEAAEEDAWKNWNLLGYDASRVLNQHGTDSPYRMYPDTAQTREMLEETAGTTALKMLRTLAIKRKIQFLIPAKRVARVMRAAEAERMAGSRSGAAASPSSPISDHHNRDGGVMISGSSSSGNIFALGSGTGGSLSPTPPPPPGAMANNFNLSGWALSNGAGGGGGDSDKVYWGDIIKEVGIVELFQGMMNQDELVTQAKMACGRLYLQNYPSPPRDMLGRRQYSSEHRAHMIAAANIVKQNIQRSQNSR